MSAISFSCISIDPCAIRGAVHRTSAEKQEEVEAVRELESCVQWCVCVCVCVCACACACVRDLAPSVLRTAPLDRCVWRQCCSNAISAFEERRTAALLAKRKARKDPVAARGTMMWTCDVCGRPCASRSGLFAHRKSHR